MKRTPFQTEKPTCIFDGCPETDLRLAFEAIVFASGDVETITWAICNDHVAALPLDPPTR